MEGSINMHLPIFGPNKYPQSKDKEEQDLKQADIELAMDLLRKARIFEKRGLAQRLCIAVFMSGNPARTSWMVEGEKEGLTISEPVDRWYRVCKSMAKEGYFRAIHYPNAE